MPVSSATLASGCTVASWCRDAVQASTGRAAIAASSVSVMVPPDGVVHRAPAGVEGLRRPRAHHIDAALPATDWRTVRIDRAGRYRHPRLHEDLVTLQQITAK